jgi:hypothetical protein
MKTAVEWLVSELPHLEAELLRPIIEKAKQIEKGQIINVSEQLPLDFVKWYSGMQEEKILKAYARWKKESGNLP